MPVAAVSVGKATRAHKDLAALLFGLDQLRLPCGHEFRNGPAAPVVNPGVCPKPIAFGGMGKL